MLSPVISQLTLTLSRDFKPVHDIIVLSVTGTAILATDTILAAFGKVQNQLNNRVSSVGLTMPSAFSVANSPVTSSGTLAVTAAGLASQYIRGDGTLADFPTEGGGGGSSVSYYLNGSVSQGTIGGNLYHEMNKTPVLGAGTDFTIATDGYIAQFLTDANDPNTLLIPAGNFNLEFYFSASSSGGTPSYYVELYKYDGATFTLIASIPIGSTIEIIPYALTPDVLGGFYYQQYPLATPITATYTGSTLSYNFSELPEMPVGGYKFKFRFTSSVFQIVETELSNVVNISNACYLPIIPPLGNVSYIIITGIEVLSIINNQRNIRITYISDLSVAFMGITLVAQPLTDILPQYNQDYFLQPQNGYVDVTLANNSINGSNAVYDIRLTALGIISNTVFS